MDDGGHDSFWSKVSAAVWAGQEDTQRSHHLTLLHHVNEVISLWSRYRELLVSLCDKLGVTLRLTLLPNVRAPTHMRMQEHAASHTGSQNTMSARHSASSSTISSHQASAGAVITTLPLNKLDRILGPLNDLGRRLQHITDIVETLRQFTALKSLLWGLPQVAVVAQPQCSDPATSKQDADNNGAVPSLPHEEVVCLAASSIDLTSKVQSHHLRICLAKDVRSALGAGFASGKCPDLAMPYVSKVKSLALGDIVDIMMDSVIDQFRSACSTTASVLNVFSGSTFNSANERFKLSVSLLEQVLCKYFQVGQRLHCQCLPDLSFAFLSSYLRVFSV